MIFSVQNKYHTSTEFLRSKTLMAAYTVIKNYPLRASDILLDRYIQQQYKMSLKDMSVKLLLNLIFYADNAGNLVLLFKDRKYDIIASLITYGNGAIPGSKILKLALSG